MVNLKSVTVTHKNGTTALKRVSLRIDDGEFVLINGHSGAGKSTIVRLLTAEDVPTSGEVVIDGVNTKNLTHRQIPKFRRRLGVVFQDFRLIPTMNVFDNIAFAMRAVGRGRKEIKKRVAAVMEIVGLTGKEKSFPTQLSGGEQQRVALARAIVNNPKMIIADEPTGNLDPTTSLGIMEVLDAINRTGTTIVMATHNEEIVNSMRKRVVELHTGKIVRDEQQGSYDSALYFPDAEVESKSHQALGTSDPNAKYRRRNAIDSTNAPDDTVDVEGATRAETVVNAVDVVAAAVHDGQGNDGIARLAKSVHSGRTGRYGEVREFRNARRFQ